MMAEREGQPEINKGYSSNPAKVILVIVYQEEVMLADVCTELYKKSTTALCRLF